MVLAEPDSNVGRRTFQQPEGSTVYYHTSPLPIPASRSCAHWWRRKVILIFTSTGDGGRGKCQHPRSARFSPAGRGLTCIPVELPLVGKPSSKSATCWAGRWRRFSGTLQAGVSRHYFRADGLAAGVYQVVLRSEGGNAGAKKSLSNEQPYFFTIKIIQ